MPRIDEHLRRAAIQQLQTTLMLGVDFIPDAGNDSSITSAAQDSESDAKDVRVVERDSTRAAVTPVPSEEAIDVTKALNDIDTERLSSPREKTEALEHLRELHDRTCPHCTTAKGHTQTVFGEGNPDADLMFIGEAPGAEEDRTGRPFVGRAGQKLNDIIGAMELDRADVYIANVLKSRPPDNRTPQPDEVAGCSPFLIKQVRIIRPKVIVTLGGPATKLILDTRDGITRIRGTWASFHAGDYEVPVMPTFHPAYLLRNYTKETRAKVWSDVQQVMERLRARSR